MADIDVVTKFISPSVVWIQAKVYNPKTDALTDTTGTIKATITDPNGLKKSGYISVSDSSTFTAGLVVTGGTSGATGYIISKPDGTTLEIQKITGVWQSGETITDTDTGTSTTTSALLGADMTKDVLGTYDYYYNTDADPVEGWYPGEVVVVDGSGTTAKTSVGPFGFDVNKGLS